jgi:hypothetical protein
MRKAMFFEEAYNEGILAKVSEGFIFSIISPDFDNIEKKLDPFLLQIVSYNGLKSIEPYGNGVKFQAQGKNMYCMLEPANYPNKHVEPATRANTNGSNYMPYRFNECDIFFTKDIKFRVLIPQKSHDNFDSFTIDFPEKGDLCVLYYIFDKEHIDSVVLPYMQENISYILKSHLPIREMDTKIIAKKFMEVVKKFDVWD